MAEMEMDGEATSLLQDALRDLLEARQDQDEPRDQQPHANVSQTLSTDQAQPINICAPISDRVAPQYKVTHERAVYGQEFTVSLGDDIDLSQLRLGCIKVTRPDGIAVFIGLILTMDQLWNLQTVAVGDLSYTTSLAPGEELSVQMQNTQRRVLEKDTLDQAEEMTSEESTTVDKEALNVARSSTKTEKWSVNGSGRLSIGNPQTLGGQLGINAGFDSATTQTANASLDQIHEATNKSAHSLKTLHKVEVRGVSEDIFEKRITRVIRNPYEDRTLSLNVFQLVKRYQVTTQLASKIPALIISVKSLEFDNSFVGAYVDFLRDNLLDPMLVDELPTAFKGTQLSVDRARTVARMALHYLYEEPNIFNLPHIVTGFPPRDLGDPNLPDSSYDASREHSGLQDSIGPDDRRRGDMARLFTILNMYFTIYNDQVQNNTIDEFTIDLALSLSQATGDLWKVAQNDDRKITDLLDNGEFTECFRRLSGFLAMVDGMLKPLTSVGEENEELQQRAAALSALQRLKDHLRCNHNYYIQKLLIHLEQSTESNAIIDFVDLVIDRLNIPPLLKQQLHQLLDIRRAYIDRQQLIVPAFRPFGPREIARFLATVSGRGTGNDGGITPIPPRTEQVEVPCDGIHIEVAQGLCQLSDLPQGQ